MTTCLDNTAAAELPAGADVYRLLDLLDRLVAVSAVAEKATVRFVPAVQLDACEECSPPEGEPIPACVVVRYGHSQPCYTVHVCETCVVPVLTRRLRYDQAAPVVEIPTGLL